MRVRKRKMLGLTFLAIVQPSRTDPKHFVGSRLFCSCSILHRSGHLGSGLDKRVYTYIFFYGFRVLGKELHRYGPVIGSLAEPVGVQ